MISSQSFLLFSLLLFCIFEFCVCPPCTASLYPSCRGACTGECGANDGACRSRTGIGCAYQRKRGEEPV